MSKRTRWILFYTAVFVFFVASYVTVVFALGYNYDFFERKLVQMGSLRVVSNTTAEVYVNEKLAGKTTFLGDTFSKGRLLPRTYTIRLQKEGHHSWEKRITVVAGQFTDMPHVILIPLQIEAEPVASSSFGFPLSDSRIKTAKNKLAIFTEHEIVIEWLDTTSYQPFHVAGDRQIIARLPNVIEDVQWHRDDDHLFISSGGILYFFETDTRGGVNIYPITTLKGPFWYEPDENAVYLMKDGELVRMKF